MPRSPSEPLTPALVAALRAQLAQGERLAWVASPEPSAFERETPGISKWDAAAILGGGYATLGACVMAFRTGRWLWLSVPISLVVLGALGYFIASWIKARARRAVAGTVYGLTTRRALIVRTYPALAVQTLPIESIADITIVDKRGYFGDLDLRAASAPTGLVFHGVVDPERARAQLMRVIRDPQGTDQQIAASEAYAMQMRQLMAGPASR